MKEKKHVHLTAICGMGMGSFAGLLKLAGYEVTGSDQNVYPPMSTQLEQMGVTIKNGYKPENVDDEPSMVIVGNAIKSGNPEIQAVMERGIPYMSFPQALKEYFLKGKKSLVVAGTHGKTTTSSILAWILQSAGRDPGFLVGGILHNFESSYKLGQGPHFVVEGDEYETAFFDKVPKFVHYQPSSAIITSIEFDHGDIYRDIEHIKDAFTRFTRLIPPEGLLMACGDFPHVKDILSQAPCRVETYGYCSDCDWTAREVYMNGETSEFIALFRGREIGSFITRLPGRHNIQNALGAIALLYREGLTVEEIREGLRTFVGVKRRQEVRAVIDGVVIIDDFAHHPTKVRETVAAIRSRYQGRRIWAIFEPRTNTSRRAFFQKDYALSFEGADKVIVAGVFNPGQIHPEDRFSPESLINDLVDKGKDALFISRSDDIVQHVTSAIKPGDVILIMSNGGFDAIHEKFVTSLNKVLA
ncbi:MAG: UDP-N-acetylmuramate:L-alanyl-gamma-D-glutamyl-meso-diaminopimelate ligase [Candidatus Eremiobacteraeota bacterium]|nr:UDP-N-acetylmuramate:L-alanyl-gamma-D-glutamyl-meso-diaminopimelate ligase [Candidatus Eremiobacteraeota bacterium]